MGFTEVGILDFTCIRNSLYNVINVQGAVQKGSYFDDLCNLSL